LDKYLAQKHHNNKCTRREPSGLCQVNRCYKSRCLWENRKHVGCGI